MRKGNRKKRLHKYRKKINWKTERRGQILRRGCLVSAAVLIFTIGFLNSMSEKSDAKETAKETMEVTVTPEAMVEEPFVNILEKNNYELAVTWDGAIKKSVLDEIETVLEEEMEAFSNAGYSAGFLLYDLNTGGGISYHADVSYYSASAIKAPYVAWVVQTYPEAAVDFYSEIENAIVWSSNEDYFVLINNFGKSGFNEWASRTAGTDIELSDGSFGPVTCRDFTRLWIDIYNYFMSEKENAEMIRELYSGTEESSIYETLGTDYTVYSKAGWSFEGEDSYYTVQNDAGIVMKDQHPYILTILSNAYERLDMLDTVVEKVDLAHTELIAQEEEE